jgi:hypothetical protein
MSVSQVGRRFLATVQSFPCVILNEVKNLLVARERSEIFRFAQNDNFVFQCTHVGRR